MDERIELLTVATPGGMLEKVSSVAATPASAVNDHEKRVTRIEEAA